ncbi:hypothetical protein PFISCL1PPCAC_228, partial [Pristionchus fissidentatus]
QMLKMLILMSFLSLAYCTVPDARIDWDRCNKDYVCYGRDSCEKGGRTLIFRQFYGNSSMEGHDCDVILQIKSYNESKLHIIIKLSVSATKFDANFGVRVNQHERVFSCKSDGITASSKFTTQIAGANIVTEDLIFCSFFLSSADGLEFDSNRLSLTCGDQQKIIVIYNKTMEVNIESVKCELQNDVYIYKYTTRGETSRTVLIPPKTQFDAHCGVLTCGQLPLINCTSCSAPEKNMTCPNNLWRLSDGTMTEGTVECGFSTVSTGNEMASEWIMITGKDRTTITEGACATTKYDCGLYSNLNFTRASPDTLNASFHHDDLKINCTEGYYLKFGGNKGRSLICNSSDGIYYSPDRKVEQGANIFCVEKSMITSDQVGLALMSVCYAFFFIFVYVVYFVLPKKLDEADAS